MSDRATGYKHPYGATGRSVVSWRLGDHLQAGGYLLRPARPPQRDLDRDGGIDHWSARRGAHLDRSLWWAAYRSAVIATSSAGVCAIILWRLIEDWM